MRRRALPELEAVDNRLPRHNAAGPFGSHGAAATSQVKEPPGWRVHLLRRSDGHLFGCLLVRNCWKRRILLVSELAKTRLGIPSMLTEMTHLCGLHAVCRWWELVVVYRRTGMLLL